MKFAHLIAVAALLLCLPALPADTQQQTAEALARAAQKARDAGQVVRAYLLYAEAAARDPKVEKYRVNRDGLKPVADMLVTSGVEAKQNQEDVVATALDEMKQPLPSIGPLELEENAKLLPPPQIELPEGKRSFHLKSNERTLYQTVAENYDLGVVFDPQMDPFASVTLDLDNVTAKQALAGLATATNTFLFAISPKAIFVARDSAQKREEYEPQVAVTVPLPDVSDPKETTEAENAVRQVFNLRHMGLDTAARTIVIRDRLSNALAARSFLETLIRKPAQLAIEAQIFEVSDQSDLHYGTSLPNTVPLINFGGLKSMFGAGGLQYFMSSVPENFVNFLTFGGGRTLFGFGVMNASAFAQYSKSQAQSIYQATVVVSSGGTASWHVGDKYPLPTMLSTGSGLSTTNTLSTYVANIQMIDLGLLIKVQPELKGDGDIAMTLHAEYQALGGQTINEVPTILQREFEGNVRLGQGEWAVLAGLDTQSSTTTKTGIAGLSEIPTVGTLFSEIEKTHAHSHTLLVLKPYVISDRPFEDRSPIYVGTEYGRKVLL